MESVKSTGEIAKTTLFRTSRLAIRELGIDDACAIFRYANDSRINKYLSFGKISCEKGTLEYVNCAAEAAGFCPRDSFKLAMTINPSTQICGSCWLDVEDRCSGNATIGYFVDPAHWGRGYATEMVRGLLEFGFEQLNLHRIYANCDSDNVATKRVLEKVGMRQEGLLRRHVLRTHGWADVCVYGILREEFSH